MSDLPAWFLGLAADRARRGVPSALYDSVIVDGLGGPTVVLMERFKLAQERIDAARAGDS